MELDQLLRQLLVSSVLMETAEDIHISRRGICFFCDGRWQADQALSVPNAKTVDLLARKIAEVGSQELGFVSPTAESLLPDYDGLGSFRAHVVIQPLSSLGTEITLRKIRFHHFSLNHFEWESKLRKEFENALCEGVSILVIGPTGSGKSSFMGAALRELPENCRIVLLEDTLELSRPNALSSHLVSRLNRFGSRRGVNWNLEDLVYESLRMRPDRIVVGECRSFGEARALHNAYLSGHLGLMTTIHGNSVDQGLKRFEYLLSNEEFSSPIWTFALSIERRISKRVIAEANWIKV